MSPKGRAYDTMQKMKEKKQVRSKQHNTDETLNVLWERKYKNKEETDKQRIMN